MQISIWHEARSLSATDGDDNGSSLGRLFVPGLFQAQVLVLLAIRALGKSKFVLCQVPSHNRRPESAVLYLVDYNSNVVPSIKDG